MSFPVLVSALASLVLLPPVSPLLLCALGLLLRRCRRRAAGNVLIVLGLAILLVLSTRAGARLLVRPLEQQYPPLTQAGNAQAIVILGAARISRAMEFEGLDEASVIGLKRLQYGVFLHRRTGLPILVTGGAPDGSRESEASLMARTLSRDFGVQARWQEGRSDTTKDNAVMSAAILKADGVTRILLVTDSIHMPRAMRAFEQAGLEPQAAPTLFVSTSRPYVTDYFPSASSMQLSSYALREWIGQLWYQLRR